MCKQNGICNGCDKRIGPYVVIKKIGEGSFSKVQLAYHVISRKKFALKLVNKQSVKNLQEITHQIKNEVELLKVSFFFLCHFLLSLFFF